MCSENCFIKMLLQLVFATRENERKDRIGTARRHLRFAKKKSNQAKAAKLWVC